MTTSLGSALPGFTPARATPEQPAANGKTDDAGFGKMLGGDTSPARPERRPTTEAGVARAALGQARRRPCRTWRQGRADIGRSRKDRVGQSAGHKGRQGCSGHRVRQGRRRRRRSDGGRHRHDTTPGPSAAADGVSRPAPFLDIGQGSRRKRNRHRTRRSPGNCQRLIGRNQLPGATTSKPCRNPSGRRSSTGL